MERVDIGSVRLDEEDDQVARRTSASSETELLRHSCQSTSSSTSTPRACVRMPTEKPQRKDFKLAYRGDHMYAVAADLAAADNCVNSSSVENAEFDNFESTSLRRSYFKKHNYYSDSSRNLLSSRLFVRACTFVFAAFLGVSVYFIALLVTPLGANTSNSRTRPDDSNASGGKLSDVTLRGFSEHADWFTALQQCNYWGGQLAESGSPALNDAIFEVCPSQRCWIGATDIEAEGRWVWSGSGDLVGSANSGDQGVGWWKPGTPDNGEGLEDEDCMYMYGTLYKESNNHKLWNDKPCKQKLSGFVCQRSTRSPNTGKPSGGAKFDVLSSCRGYKSQMKCTQEQIAPWQSQPPITKQGSSREIVQAPNVIECDAITHVRRSAQKTVSRNRKHPIGFSNNNTIDSDAIRNSNQTTSFAVIGDFGMADALCEKGTIGLLAGLEKDILGGHPFDFIASTGDNAYWEGDCQAYNDSVLPFFGDLIPKSSYTCNDRSSPAADDLEDSMSQAEFESAKFWPTIGNHDWRPAVGKHSTISPYHGAIPYFQVFPHVARLDDLDGDWMRSSVNSTGIGSPVSEPAATPTPSTKSKSLTYGGFYRKPFAGGLIEMFALNSNLGNPQEGEHMFSSAHKAQTRWLRHSLKSSSAAFKIVVFHHPPFSTAKHDPPAIHMRLPFKKWGADLVLTGHQHVYERLNIEGMTYIINGLGGHHWIYEINNCETVEVGSKIRYNAAHGVIAGVASSNQMALCFYSLENNGTLIDQIVLPRR